MTETKKQQTLSVETTVVIPLQRISDLLCNALEGGSNYWYRIKEKVKPERFEFYSDWDSVVNPDEPTIFPHLDYPLNPGGSLLIVAFGDEGRDEINGKREWRLDLTTIKAGLERMGKMYADSHFADFLAENDDATTGDVFLQLCLFGEVVYG